MKSIRNLFRSKSGLQMRMTLWVVGTVSVVAVLVMFISTAILRDEYENEVRERLESDIEATVKLIDQRMIRVEYVTRAAASFLESMVDAPQDRELETMLSDLLRKTECVDAVTFALDNGNDTTATIYSAFRKYASKDRETYSIPPVKESLDGDLNWERSFKEQQDFWCVPFTPRDFPDAKLQCFSVPVYNRGGECRGMFCTMVLEQWIEEIIKKYKIRSDIDVSIYNKEGTLIVKLDNNINKLSSDDMIVEEREIDRLAWRIVFSSDSQVITGKLASLVWHMVGMIVILLLFTTIAIVLSIRYVARPFVWKQQHVAEAKAAIERELQIAAETQRQLVPHTFPPFPERPEVSIHACLHPALQIGGDLYDYFIQQDELYFCIGDVSGKGAPASLFMAATHYLFRNTASAMSVSAAVQQMNLSLCTDNEKCTFVTFFFARLDLKTGLLEYCNAGHNPPVLMYDGEVKFFAKSESTPLGVWEEAEYPSHSIQLNHGDTLLLYTDGVTEAMDSEGKEFGNENTLSCVTESNSKTPEGLINSILQRVHQHAGDTPQSDDITMLCIRWEGC